jgi:hypothetical protein
MESSSLIVSCPLVASQEVEEGQKMECLNPEERIKLAVLQEHLLIRNHVSRTLMRL